MAEKRKNRYRKLLKSNTSKSPILDKGTLPKEVQRSLYNPIVRESSWYDHSQDFAYLDALTEKAKRLAIARENVVPVIATRVTIQNATKSQVLNALHKAEFKNKKK
jgi:uncharacterized protein YecE (DUF72 family)